MLAHELHQLGRVPRQADDLKARRLEQAGDALTQEDVIVCNHHTEVSHGQRRHPLMAIMRGFDRYVPEASVAVEPEGRAHPAA